MTFKRWAGIAGLAGVVVIVGSVIAIVDAPEAGASGAEVLEWLADDRALLETSLVLTAASLFLIGVFLVGLFGWLRDRERGSDDYWSLVGLAGGILTGAGIAVVSMVETPAAVRGDELDAATAQLLSDLSSAAVPYIAVATALAMMGYSVALLRTKTMAPWVAWLGLVGAAVNVVGGIAVVPTAEESGIGVLSYVGGLVLLLWVLILSLAMVRPGTIGSEAPATA